MSPESKRPNLGSAEDIYADLIARRERGEAVEWESLLANHPELSEELQALHDTTDPPTTDEVEWGETHIVDSESPKSSEPHPRDDEQIVLVTHSGRYLPDDHLGQGGNRGFAAADRVETTATVDDGLLQIGFVPLRENAKLSGLEIRRAN